MPKFPYQSFFRSVVETENRASKYFQEEVMSTKEDSEKIGNGSFRKFLYKLGEHLTSDDVRKLKFLSELPGGKCEKIENGLDLLVALERHDVISETSGGLKSLCNFLKEIHRIDLVGIVDEYKKEESTTTVQYSITKNKITNSKPVITQPLLSSAKTGNGLDLKPPSSFTKVKNLPSLVPEQKLKGQVATTDENLDAKLEYELYATANIKNLHANPSDTSSDEKMNSKSSGFALQRKDYALMEDTHGNNNYYEMKKTPKGICLVISNEKFDDQDDRNGSDVDAKNIECTFDALGFNVRVHENARVLEEREGVPNLIEIFKNCAEEDHTNYSCFVAFILSHGSEDGIYGVDGRTVNINRIIDPFKTCKSLSGKPKLFFGQFCQGENEDKITVDYPCAVDTFKSGYHPKEADFYIGYATPPGYVAYRSEINGSWFISKLCAIFKAYALKEDLSKMMTKVCGEVKQAYTNKNCKQVVQIVTTLTKDLHF